MDSYEASSLIFTKVKSIDPENAKKIMGYILIQDLAENDLMRLAFGPENLLHSMVIRARIHLGLSSNTSSTPSSPSTLNPIQRPSVAGNPFSSSSSQSSPRVIVPNGFPSPSPSSPSTWSLSGLSNSPKSHPLMAAPESSELVDDGHLTDYLSFLSEDPELFPHHHHHSNGDGDGGHFHRRSFSASDASEEFGAGFKPCLYFARGFCKNGSSCKFVHGFDQSEAEQQLQQHDDLFRLKAAAAAAQQQQRLMTLSPSVYNKYMNLILQQQQHHDPQRAAAAAMMMGEEIYSKFGRCSRSERSEFLSMAEKMNSASRQIYLTFPAESTFKDEDVSEYFNKFGPVQDVRIPYQQKRMFGFVTFVHPETVRFILSKGNPHFICDSRVLVKPYKEKGKVLDKRQQNQMERGEFSSCSSPSERDSYEGGRMFYGAGQEMLLRRKLEAAELHQALEIQGRRIMNLQLPDFHNKSDHHHHQRMHNHHRSLSLGASILSPHHQNQHHSSFSPTHFDPIIQDLSEGHDEVTVTLPPAVSMQQNHQHHGEDNGNGDGDGNSKEDLDLQKSMEQSLPENLFASPTKYSGDHRSESVVEEVSESSTAATATSNGSSAGF